MWNISQQKLSAFVRGTRFDQSISGSMYVCMRLHCDAPNRLYAQVATYAVPKPQNGRNYAVKYALQWRYISFWWLAPTFRLQQTLGNITKTHARCLLSLCVYGGVAAWHFVMNVCVWLFCEVVVFVLQLYFGKPWFREKVLTTKALT